MSHMNFQNNQQNRYPQNFTSLNTMPLQRTVSDSFNNKGPNPNLQRKIIKNSNGNPNIKLYYKKPRGNNKNQQINTAQNLGVNNSSQNQGMYNLYQNQRINNSSQNQGNNNFSKNQRINNPSKNQGINNPLKNPLNSQVNNSNISYKNNYRRKRATSQVVKKTSAFFDDNNSVIKKNNPEFFAQRKNSGMQKKINFVEFGTVNGKKELIVKIEDKNKVVKQLSNNYNFFKQECEKRKEEFYKKMKYDIKGKIYDKVLKGNLHYISKYYDNLNKNQPDIAHQVLNTNLKKTQKEINILNQNIEKLKIENEKNENLLKLKVNEIGAVKVKKEIIGNLNKEEIEKKIIDLKAENLLLDNNYKELQIKEKKALYDLKFKHELKGRKMMEESALKLALENYDKNDFEQNNLAVKIQSILNDLEYKNKIKEDNYYFKLMEKKKKLEQELSQLI